MRPRLAICAFAVAVAATACGGGGDDAPPVAGGTAEGLWHGTTSNGLVLTVLVRDSGEYFAIYAHPAAPDSFGVAVAGTGTSSSGVFATPVSSGSDRLGANYVARTSFNGSFIPANPVLAGATFATKYDPAYDGTPTQPPSSERTRRT